jgi:hypothetical protein
MLRIPLNTPTAEAHWTVADKKIELFTSLKSPIAVSARSCFARASAREV